MGKDTVACCLAQLHKYIRNSNCFYLISSHSHFHLLCLHHLTSLPSLSPFISPHLTSPHHTTRPTYPFHFLHLSCHYSLKVLLVGDTGGKVSVYQMRNVTQSADPVSLLQYIVFAKLIDRIVPITCIICYLLYLSHVFLMFTHIGIRTYFYHKQRTVTNNFYFLISLNIQSVTEYCAMYLLYYTFI